MHRILTQTLDISTATEAAALDVQRVLSRAFAGAERRRIERLFDRLAGQGTLRIDRLELDLGVISGGDWLDRLFDRLAEAAERAILAEDPSPPPGRAAPRPLGGATAARAIGVTRPDAPRGLQEAVAAYLATGRLPWWSDLVPEPGWLGAAIERLNSAARQAIVVLVAAQPRALHRIVLALTPEAVAALLAPRIPMLKAGRLASLAAILAEAPAAGGAVAALARDFWAACLEVGSAAGEMRGAGAGATALRQGLARIVASGAQTGALTGADARAFAAALPPEWRAPFRADCAAAGWPGLPVPPGPLAVAQAQSGRSRPADGPVHGSLASAADLRAQDRAAQALSGPRADASARPRSLEDAQDLIPVVDAGLVLFHPFLPELFTRCGYWDGTAFAGPAEQHAAARLLGHVAHGDAEVDEALLTLPKLLVGIDPPEAVLDPAPPDAEAIAKADALIGAVLGHWSALKSRDPDFLREGFVRRAGHLSRSDDGWALRVESLAQDVLIDRLPWGFGVIRLPWLTKVMTVRWRD